MATPLNFSALLREELTWFADSKKRIAFLFLLPLVCLLILSAIYAKGSARELPVAVIDYDQTYLSRMIIRSLDGTGAMKVIDGNNQTMRVEDYFLKNTIYGVFVIPRGFETDIKHGNKTVISFYKSSYNLIVSNSLLSDANNAVRSVSGGILIQKLQAKGFTPQQALVCAKPVRVNITALYNPWYNYEVFLVYPMFLAILQIVLAVAGVFLGNQFRKRLFSGDHPGFNALHLVWISAIGALFIIVVNLFISTLVNRYLFAVTTPGNGLYAWLLIFAFMYFLFTAGNIAGMVLEHRETAVQVIVFFLTPAFILSGYTYPVWGMPRAIQVLAEVSPFTHFMRGYITIAHMNEPASAVHQSAIIGGLMVVTVLLQVVVLYMKGRKL